MASSIERRRRKKRKIEKLDWLEHISRELTKRSRSSSFSVSRKKIRHRRKRERKSRKFHRYIKQETIDAANEVVEISGSETENSVTEIITIDEDPPQKSWTEIYAQPKTELVNKFRNGPESIDIDSDQNEAAPDASQREIEFSVTTQPNRTENLEQTLQIEPEQESVVTVCSKLVGAWQNILHFGLSSQANEELVKKYRLTEGNQAFKAATLNQAIKSLLSGPDIVTDEIEMAKQNHLGSLLAAIEKCTYLIVNSEKRCSSSAKVVETLHDAASFIAQLHYSVSLQRRIRVAERIGIAKMEIATRVAESLFSKAEEEEMQRRVTELIELEIIDDEVEKRLAAIKKAEFEKAEEAKKIAEEKAKKLAAEEAEKRAEERAKEIANKMAEEEAHKMAEIARKMAEDKDAGEQPTDEQEEDEEEEEEENETPCTQRFSTSRYSKRTIIKAKVEGIRAVKSERKVKSEKESTPQFVPDCDFPGIEEVMKMTRERQGFSQSAIPIALKAVAKSTLSTYKTHIQRWWNFSREQSCDTFDPKLSDLMEFFVKSRENGMSMNTLTAARTALGFLLTKDLAKNEYFSIFFQGLSK